MGGHVDGPFLLKSRLGCCESVRSTCERHARLRAVYKIRWEGVWTSCPDAKDGLNQTADSLRAGRLMQMSMQV